MEQWRPETAAIIKQHKNDFNVTNYDAKIKAAGGYAAYVQSLGGIFARGCPKIRSYTSLWDASEYVMGLMAIYGFDYAAKVYYQWGNGAADRFYTVGRGKCNAGTISELCQGKNGKTRTTCCNYGIDTLLRAGGIYRMACDRPKGMVNDGIAKIVMDKNKLQPGDLVHFFGAKVTANKDTWKNWRHVAIVLRIDKSGPVLADFGSRFIRSTKPYHAWSEYKYAGWVGLHIYNLEDDTMISKSEADKAVELHRAIKSYLDAKKAEYGAAVYDLAQIYDKDRDAYLRAAADYVLDDHAGRGEARKAFFGSEYDDVQNNVNRVLQLAQDVIDGKYGNGEDRRKALGADYDIVQKQVDRILKLRKALGVGG